MDDLTRQEQEAVRHVQALALRVIADRLALLAR